MDARGMSRRSRSVRTWLVLGAVVLLAVAGITPAAAYQQTKSTGTPGVYVVDDTNGSPGVTCTYASTATASKDGLTKIRVKGFYAHGTSSTQRYVGFGYVISRKASGGSSWVTKYTSTIVKQKATSTTPTLFAARTYQLASTAPNDGSQWRVGIRLYWYGADGTTVVASAGGPIEVYRLARSGSSSYTLGSEGSGAACKANFHF